MADGRGVTPQRATATFWVGGVLLVVAALATTLLAPHFAIPVPSQGPVLPLVGLLGAAGLAYLAVAVALPRLEAGGAQTTGWPLVWVVVVGLLLRLLLWPSGVILEDDLYRYLLDGALVVHGYNPYAWSPQAVMAAQEPALAGVVAASEGLVADVNHPHLRTLYPPVAQAFFALSYLIEPWSVAAWRGVLLAADLCSLALGLALLGAMGRSPLWVALFWWNPLYVHLVFNTGHMEGVLVPFLLGGLLLAIHHRPLAASVALAAATLVKFWPALLLPLVLRPLTLGRQLQGAGLFAAIVAVGLIPQALAGLDRGAGLRAYTLYWRNNSPLFANAVEGMEALLAPWGIGPATAHSAVRLLCAVAALGLALAVAWRPPRCPADWGRKFALVAAGTFFFSPAKFPWYGAWFIPLLPLAPWWPLLLLTPLLSLYYLRFALDSAGLGVWFDRAVVYVEYAPVWLALAIVAWRRWRWGGGVP